MFRKGFCLWILAVVPITAFAADSKLDFSTAYQECNAGFQGAPGDVAGVLAP